MLGQSASKMGYNLTPPLERPVPDYKPVTYNGEMIPILQKKPDLIMVVIQNNKSDLYAVTKKLCVVKHPTPSQVIKYATIKKLCVVQHPTPSHVNCSHNFLKVVYPKY